MPDREQLPAEAIYPALLVIVMLLVLPHFGPVAMMIGSALGLAGQVLVMPDHFRSRSGSLVPAIVFVTAFGLAMGVVAVLSLFQG